MTIKTRAGAVAYYLADTRVTLAFIVMFQAGMFSHLERRLNKIDRATDRLSDRLDRDGY